MTENEPWKTFQHDKILAAITLAGSQSALAYVMDVHKQVISRWKLCQVRMSLDCYLKLDQYLNNNRSKK